MNLFKKRTTVVTHDGDFHSDDIFACAALSLWMDKNNRKLEIIRSREREKAEKADIVVDVGEIYDPERDRFDHHQRGGAGMRENSIPYASFGLVWKKYGQKICNDQAVADKVDKELIAPIDARDNGITISVPNNNFGIYDYRLGSIIGVFNLTPSEDKKLSYQQFKKALSFAREVLTREIVWAKVLIDGYKETLKIIREQNEPEILILDKDLEWHEAVSKNKHIKFVVYSRKNEQEWCIQVGRDDLENYNSNRIKFPDSWRGLRNEELAKASGVKDAVFCINGGWFAVTKTKEGAIEFARKALENHQLT